MTALEFVISVRNKDAVTGIQEMSASMTKLNKESSELFEGMSGERKMRSAFAGLTRDLMTAQDPMSALLAMGSRLTEAFRFILPIGLLAGVLGAVGIELEKAAKSAEKLKKEIQDALDKSPDTESLSGLKKDIQEFDAIAKQYEDRGMLEKFFFGSDEDRLFERLESLNAVKKNLLELREIANGTREALIGSLESSDDPADQQKGKIMASQAKADKEQEVTREAMESDEAQLKAHQDKLAALDQAFALRRAGALTAGRRTMSMGDLENYQASRAALIESIDSDKALLAKRNTELGAQQKAAQDEQAAIKREGAAKVSKEIADELEKQSKIGKKDSEESLQRDIAAAQARQILGATPLDRVKARTDELEAQNKLNELKVAGAKEMLTAEKDLAKEQYESLSREQKIAALKAESARLEKELGSGKLSPLGKIHDEARLMEVLKALGQEEGADHKRDYEKTAYDSFSATGGRLSGVSYGLAGMSNDKADKAAAQRDTTNAYLSKILGKFNIANVESF